MTWAFDQIKSALREKAERRSVDELVESGARSVRVISEQTIYRLIQAVVDDTLAAREQERGAPVPAEDRERIATQAKERLERLLRQNTLQEQKSRRQQETILTYQRQLERLERERVAAAEKARALHERDQAVRREAREATGALEAAQAELSGARAERDALRAELESARAAMQAAQAAQAAAQTAAQAAARSDDGAARRSLDALRAELGDVRAALAELASRPAAPEGLPAAQLEELLARLQRQESEAAGALEARFERNMGKVLDEVGRTMRAATARPVDRPVEATEALLAKMFEREGEMESNLGEVGVPERASERTIDKSLERLRAARRPPTPEPPRDADAPASADARDAVGDADDAAADEGDEGEHPDRRRHGVAERRRADTIHPAEAERRTGPRDRRTT